MDAIESVEYSNSSQKRRERGRGKWRSRTVVRVTRADFRIGPNCRPRSHAKVKKPRTSTNGRDRVSSVRTRSVPGEHGDSRRIFRARHPTASSSFIERAGRFSHIRDGRSAGSHAVRRSRYGRVIVGATPCAFESRPVRRDFYVGCVSPFAERFPSAVRGTFAPHTAYGYAYRAGLAAEVTASSRTIIESLRNYRSPAAPPTGLFSVCPSGYIDDMTTTATPTCHEGARRNTFLRLRPPN